MVATYAYTTTPGRLKELLERIPTVGLPKKADKDWLAQNGFTTVNDPKMLTVAKFVGIIDAVGVPTDVWKGLRIKDGKPLARAIRESYNELYELYENAQERPDSDLGNFFRQKISAGDSVVKPTVATFKMLCSFADFNGSANALAAAAADAMVVPVNGNAQVAADGGIPGEAMLAAAPVYEAPTAGSAPAVSAPRTVQSISKTTASGIPVTINIQLTLPESQDPKVYESIFKAMKDCFLS